MKIINRLSYLHLCKILFFKLIKKEISFNFPVVVLVCSLLLVCLIYLYAYNCDLNLG